MSELFGYAVGRGIRSIIDGVGNASQVRRALNPRRFVSITAPLPVYRWSTRSGEFAVGLPWGFRDLDSADLESAGQSIGLPGSMLDGFADDRNDSNTTHCIIAEVPDFGTPTELFLQAEELMRVRAQRLTFQPLGDIFRFRIGDEFAVLWHLYGSESGASRGVPGQISLTTTEAYTFRRRRAFRLEFTGPSEQHSLYMPAFWTMVGSWRWRA